MRVRMRLNRLSPSAAPRSIDAQNGVVPAPEGQEAVDELVCGHCAGLADPGAARDQFGQARPLLGHLVGEFKDGALDVGEVLIERCGGGARHPGDVDHLDVPIR